VLTGVFPEPGVEVESGPLELLWCGACTLVQLGHSFAATAMYGENYGYRSGLNAGMVEHLQGKVLALQELAGLQPGDVVLDIGCNDGTTLAGYTVPGLRLLGIDPTAAKFSQYHPDGMEFVNDFFSVATFRALSDTPAKVITSIAMFYDLDDPAAFAADVAECLHTDGVWHFEQSYMPSMLRTCSYDTVCHEHVEYYSLRNVCRILDQADLKILSVRFNNVNGGSFSVTAGHRSSTVEADGAVINWLIDQETRLGLTSPTPFRAFEERVYRHRDDLSSLLRTLKSDGKSVLGYGASTKGNVLLQFCNIDVTLLPAIGEVNPDKFGRVTPGTEIPIIPEDDVRAANPDYLFVLPWHFREGIVRREKEFLRRGGRIIFPLPEIEIVGD
jgi:SAM-dependent methyltransferase